MANGPCYLLGAVGESTGGLPITEAAYRQAVTRCVTALDRPGALEGRCASPVGFEWSVGEAAAGTFMDQLVHGWDLAVAIGQDPALDGELAQLCVDMFLPRMPEMGRVAGIVGPEVSVPEDASAQDRLLAAMGRRPE
jgi:uncharacterized protein (TIGR03086 family)